MWRRGRLQVELPQAEPLHGAQRRSQANPTSSPTARGMRIMMQKWVVRRSGRFRTTSGQTNADRSYCRDVPIARVALAGMCECVGARVRSVVKGWAAPRWRAG